MTHKLQKLIQRFGFLVLFMVGLIIAFSLEPISEIFSNYRRILTSSSVLLLVIVLNFLARDCPAALIAARAKPLNQLE